MGELSDQIKVTVVKAPITPAEETDLASPLSIYIYIAGLMVSLSGMYAATYAMPNTDFALTLRSLVVCGYCVSYWLRRNNIDLKHYQAPLLVVFATVMYFVASTAPELSSAMSSNGLSRPYQIQVVVIWIAVLQSFTLCVDSAILFACVPSMALLGIASSGTPDNEVQYAFYVFLAATTFLMVHENHLRTRTVLAQRNRSTIRQDSRLFRGEIILVGCCILGTMLLATLVATPIEIVGHALIPVAPHEALTSTQNKQLSASANVRVDEGPSMDIAMGPPTDTDVDLLSVSAKVAIPYLRGATYDFYQGQRFENTLPDGQEITPTPSERRIRYGSGSKGAALTPDPTVQFQNQFDINSIMVDVGTGRMTGAQEINQYVKVLGGTITHLYGAPVFESVITDYYGLKASMAGEVTTLTPMVQGRGYHITSLIPNSDPNTLRQSGTNYPDSVVPRYLQVTQPDHPRNHRLQAFADECTAGKTNPYDKVEAIREAIANRCVYNLQAPAVARDRDVVEAFLFDTRQGYCDSFAAALTVLCRYAKVPARLASGFIQGDPQPDGTFLVKAKHKHAWTEVYFTDIGWVPFDATVGARALQTESAALKTGASPFRWLTTHGLGPPAVMLLILVLIGYVINTEILSRYRAKMRVEPQYEALPASNMEIVLQYQKACKALAQRGLLRPAHLTPTEYRLEIADRLPISSQTGELLNELTQLHQKYAYGRATAVAAEVLAARTAVEKLIAAVPKLPPSSTGQPHRTI